MNLNKVRFKRITNEKKIKGSPKSISQLGKIGECLKIFVEDSNIKIFSKVFSHESGNIYPYKSTYSIVGERLENNIFKLKIGGNLLSQKSKIKYYKLL